MVFQEPQSAASGMSGCRQPEMFAFDEEGSDCNDGPSGQGTPNLDEDAGSAGPSDRANLDPFRRAMPQIEVEEDVCSICLDAFTEDDPGNPTVCGHSFHLQCIMQWAQRSRECPLCFHALALQDAAMQELLPFGEYVPPENGSIPAAFLSLEALDMDRLLQRLALQSSAHPRRSRTRQRTRLHSLQVPPQGADEDRGPATARANMPGSSQQAAQSGEDSYPSSWPPRGMPLDEEGHPSEGQNLHRIQSNADPKTTAESLKARWSNFRSSLQSRCRESIYRSTSGFKGKAEKSEPNGHGQPPH